MLSLKVTQGDMPSVTFKSCLQSYIFSGGLESQVGDMKLHLTACLFLPPRATEPLQGAFGQSSPEPQGEKTLPRPECIPSWSPQESNHWAPGTQTNKSWVKIQMMSNAWIEILEIHLWDCPIVQKSGLGKSGLKSNCILAWRQKVHFT